MAALDNLRHYLRLYYTPGIGFKRFQKIIQTQKDLPSFFASTALQKQIGLNEAIQQALKKPDWKKIEYDLEWSCQPGQQILSLQDENYPPLLLAIEDPPAILYVKGKVRCLSFNQLAIVGSRNSSTQGIKIARDFSYNLAEYGWTITSGLARGIDSASHESAMQAGGITIAVLGSGLENVYPRNHQFLVEKIISQAGAVISEFSPLTPPHAENFPRRNRVISGLSKGVLVVEAALKSGSLITARYALEQGREVFAVPGNIYHPLAKGCHQLLREGAVLAESIEDILNEFSLPPRLLNQKEQSSPFPPALQLSEEEQILFECLNFFPTPIDRIIEETGFCSAKVCSLLMDLELAGIVTSNTGGYSRV